MPDHRSARRRGERKPRVELFYDLGCAHLEEARREISAALREEGLTEHWEEWGQKVVGDEQTFGSPTVTVDGRDVASGDLARRTASGSCCRVYVDGNSLRGSPSCATIRKALRASRN